jgi:hypothetical protein
MIPLNSDFLTELVKQFGAIAKELSQEIIFLVIGIFILMNYWFIAIFLLANDFYHNNFWISIDISFILSITWFLINVLLFTTFYLVISNQNTKTHHLFDKMLILISSVMSVISLSLILYITYCWNYTFTILLFGCVLFSVCIFALIVIFYILTKRPTKNSK